MRLNRWAVLVLALMVSPVGAAVCEVVCGSPVHAAAHAPAHHDHHAHHASPAAPVVPVSDAGGRMHAPGPDCDPVLDIAARVRSTFSGPDLHAAVVSRLAAVIDADVPTHLRVVISDTSPPDPPRHAPIPLRI